mgnify:CR=1 FL=1
MQFCLLDVVKLRERLLAGMDDGSDVPAGSVGTIVEVLSESEGMYLVEFSDDEGRTLGLPAVSHTQIEPAP